MSKLHIGEGLNLPLDFVTQTQAILAKKRVGKSYTASVQAEELLKAHQQIVVIDPTGAWWGLKSSADGKHEGFPIAVFGGEHADVPLEETAGETIATALVEQRFSAILDLTLFRKGQINRFMTPFLEALYRLNREAMHLFVDEADAIAPQKPFGEEARMLGAMEDVVRRGGIRGIGTTLITQRPAVLNKNVLTQCEILCAMRIVHHKDIDAIHEWVAVHGDEKLADKMIKSLPSLPVGTAWFWAPGWGDLFQQVKIRERTTFDSGATPKPGETKRTAKVLASVDLQKLGKMIQATVERVKENDPKELKKKISQLQSELRKQPAAKTVAAPPDERAIQNAVRQAEAPLRKQLDRMLAVTKEVSGQLLKAAARLAEVANIELPAIQLPKVTAAPVVQRPVAIARPRPQSSGNGDSSLGKAQRKILSVLAVHGPCGKNKLAILAGYAKDGGAFNNPVGNARTNGWVTAAGVEPIAITEEGLAALGEVDALPEGQELFDFWMRSSTLGHAEREILRVLSESSTPLSKNEIAERTVSNKGTPYEPEGGAFNNPLGKLRTLGLVDGYGQMQLCEELREAVAA